VISVKTFVFNPFRVNTYVLSDETGECMVVDAGCSSDNETQQLIGFIKANKLHPARLVLTHGHFDHVMGLNYLFNHFKLKAEIHKEDLIQIEKAYEQAAFFGLHIESIPVPDLYIEDGTLIRFGHSETKILHVPGHSRGSVAVYSEKDNFVVTGDALFKYSIGRTDLPGGDYDMLINSIYSKLLVLNDEVIIYPGHGPQSSIRMERKLNPFLNET
jgi:hydroxyacylglutathione hydrolase